MFSFALTSRLSDNPYQAAQKFLETNDLPLSYLDEVVRFIEKNTASVSIGSGSNDFSDPFTGKFRTSAQPISVV